MQFRRIFEISVFLQKLCFPRLALCLLQLALCLITLPQFIAAIIAATSFSYAEELNTQPSTLKVIYQMIESEESPEKGYFFIRYDNGEVKVFSAEFYAMSPLGAVPNAMSPLGAVPNAMSPLGAVPNINKVVELVDTQLKTALAKSQTKSVATSSSIGRYVFGAVIKTTQIQPKAKLTLAAISAEHKLYLTQEFPLETSLYDYDQGDSLRVQIKDLGIELNSLEEQRRRLDDEQRRLVADIDLLSGSGRLKDTDKDIARAVGELEGLKRDAQMLKALLTSVKTVKEPRAYQNRESLILQSIGELATLNSKLVQEKVESVSPKEIDRKKMLADIGRTSSIPALTKELEGLRKKRQELEEGL